MSDDYMKYDGTIAEPPYATVSDFIDQVEDLESQLASISATLHAIREVGEDWIRDESLVASYDAMSRIYEILNTDIATDDTDEEDWVLE